MKVVADMSALLSLQFSSLLEKCIENFDLIIGNRIKKELEKISVQKDELGKSANEILKFVEQNKIAIVETEMGFEKGEYEALELLRRGNYPLLISDDIKFVKKEEKEERISFSTINILTL